jgi:hypothetical protein
MTGAFMSDSQCSILIDRSNARTKERVYVVASNFCKWQILLKRSFFADEPKIFTTADALRARRCEGLKSFTQNRPRTFVAAIQSVAAVPISRSKHSVRKTGYGLH